uniref:Uncharacterized protein n=1 Tax=Aeromicrobium erythreum TaxID=2041 RepID=Q5Y9I5_9ACTN|nr:unknown [Aeromicrobium erythreum]
MPSASRRGRRTLHADCDSRAQPENPSACLPWHPPPSSTRRTNVPQSRPASGQRRATPESPSSSSSRPTSRYAATSGGVALVGLATRSAIEQHPTTSGTAATQLSTSEIGCPRGATEQRHEHEQARPDAQTPRRPDRPCRRTPPPIVRRRPARRRGAGDEPGIRRRTCLATLRDAVDPRGPDGLAG